MTVRAKTIILVLIACGLFLMPNLLWGGLYNVGGDDSRLYYLFPSSYLQNYAFNLISHNTLGGNLGYIPVSYAVPVVFLISVVKTLLPSLNTQFLVYGFIFSFGFLFFYLLLAELAPKQSGYAFWARILASFLYLFSPFVTRTYFQEQIISVFLLMVVPGSLYFFVAGIKRKRIILIFLSAILYGLFSATVYSSPWFFPTMVTFIPFFIWFALKQGRYFWKAAVLWVIIVILLNFYWIIHYLIPIFYNSGNAGIVSQLNSSSFIQENHDLIAALSLLNSPVSQIVHFVRTGWSDRRGITIWESLGSMYILVILFAGTLLQKIRKEVRELYLALVSGLIVAMMFVTPNFGSWNLSLFEFFNDHVPLFGIARTMYDKFALGMAIQCSLALYVSLVILEESKVKHVVRYAVIVVLLGFTLINAWPYVKPVYNDTSYSTRISGVMNHDYMDMTKYIASMRTSSRFLWYPMTFPGYVYISDQKNSNHFYSGLSPLQLFSRKSDMAGFYGLSTPMDPTLNWKILDLLTHAKYDEIGEIFASQNIGYVIVNNEQLPSQGQASLEGFNFMELQNNNYKSAILGDKVKDFGTRYSLYTLNSKFAVPTIFLTDRMGGSPIVTKNVSFSEQDGEYDVVINNLLEPMELILLEPYNGLWKAQIVRGEATISPKPILAYGYGNAWTLTPGKSGAVIHIRIYFWPNRFTIL